MAQLTVLHIIPNLHIGGAQRSLFNIIKSIPTVNHVIYSKENEWPVEDLPRAKFIDNSSHNFLDVINKINPNLVHFQWWPAYELPNFNILRSRFRWKFKILVTIQDPATINNNSADYYVSCGEYVDSLQKKVVSNDKRTVIPDYIDLRKFINIKKIRHNGINVVRHSMIFPNKINREILVNTQNNLKCINEKYTSLKTRFIICGDGETYREKIVKFIQEKNLNLIDLRWGSEINRVLSMGDIFLYNTPSFESEGYANVISEAEAVGLPIIADNRGGNIEQIEDGKNGFLINNFDEQKKALIQLLDINKRINFAKASRKLVLQTGGLQSLGNRYLKVYQYLIRNR